MTTETDAELLEALRDVADPLRVLRREAAAQGCQLSGMAYAIAQDVGFIQGIARKAIAKAEAHHV